ncbi:MAG TPA: hypothetical protein VIU15_08495 [Streptomyces sp.]
METSQSTDPVEHVATPRIRTGGSDPRVRRTRRSLQEAMASLVEEASPVTMSAVAQRAGLSRQVLHNHYDSIEPLAAQVLVRRILEGAGHEAPPEPETALQALVDAVRRDGLAPFLAFIQRDRDVFLALRELAHGQTTVMLARVFSGLASGHPNIDETAAADKEAALFAAGGMTTLVDAWLHMPAPPDAAARAALLERYAHAVFTARP